MTEGERQGQTEVFEYLAHEKPRPGQVEMIRESTEALRSRGYHLAAAPTGIGKTAAALEMRITGRQATCMPTPSPHCRRAGDMSTNKCQIAKSSP